MHNGKIFKCALNTDFKNGFTSNKKEISVEMPKNAKILERSFSPDGQNFLALFNPQGNAALEQRPFCLVKVVNNLTINSDMDDRDALATIYNNDGIFVLFAIKR